MSVRRLVATVAAMGGIGVALGALSPGPAALIAALASAQRLSDTAGPDAVVLCVAGLLAWACWAWGALGLGLTALGALPGAAGLAARLLLRLVLPESARRAAAVALGVGLSLNGPLLAGTAFAADHASVAAGSIAGPVAAASIAGPVAAVPVAADAVPDWPAAPPQPAQPTQPTRAAQPTQNVQPTPTPTPDAQPTPTPTAPPSAPYPSGMHTVVPGECLWTIAADSLHASTGRSPGAVEVAESVGAWWAANRVVIGADPDLLLPGQVLQPPPPP